MCGHVTQDQSAICLRCCLVGLREEGPKNNTLLIGNGLGRAYPDDTIRNAFDFKGCIIKEKFHNDLEKEIDYCRFSHPETLQNIIRLYFLYEVLSYYISQFQASRIDFARFESQNLHTFIVLFKKVITINYDPLLYWCSLASGYTLEDGIFGNGQPHTVTQIKDQIQSSKNKIPLYYLHGAYHLYSDKEKGYWKLSTAKQFHFNEFTGRLKEIIESSKDQNDNSKQKEWPLIIFEDRSSTKRQLIKATDYLNLCFEQLKCLTGTLMIYGCSFEKDEYILECIAAHNCPRKLNQIYITYLPSDRQRLENIVNNYLRKMRVFNVTWVEIQDNEKEYIWNGKWDHQKNTPHT